MFIHARYSVNSFNFDTKSICNYENKNHQNLHQTLVYRQHKLRKVLLHNIKTTILVILISPLNDMSIGKGYMQTNINNLVNLIKLKDTNYLFPLYEVVINSIQSIHEAKIPNGKIEIYVKRADSNQINTDQSVNSLSKIVGFEIADNGIGFDTKNFESFNELYTGHKINLGCKGVGRFMSLAAFNKVQVDSGYYEGGKKYRRIFEFDAKNGVDQISNLVSPLQEAKTIVKLIRYHDRYLKSPPPEIIATKVLEHCLIYFISGTQPRISIFDDASAEVINLNDLFTKKIVPDELVDEFEIEGEKFELNYVKNRLRHNNHKVHYCAHNREVDTKKLVDLIPDLKDNSLHDEQGNYSLSIYIKGEVLNRSVNDHRNEFTIPKTSSEKDAFNNISFEEINEKIADKVRSKYAEAIERFSAAKITVLKNYIYTERLEYRHLLEHSELLSSIPPGLNDKEKDYHLHRINYELDKEQKERVNELLTQPFDQIRTTSEYKTLLNEVLSFESESGKSRLAMYMMHRKTVLKILERYLRVQQNGKYMLEEDLHEIIFKMNSSSNQISFNDHNLWILDEKIAYHQFISSDKKFNEVETIKSGSTQAADIFIYNQKFAFGEAKDAVVFFEFKRPMRTNFTNEEKDLGNQIMKYVFTLMDSKAKDYKGRYVNIDEGTPKFGYVICDYDKDMEKHLQRLGYKFSSRNTLYKYEEGVNLFIEILNYEQLLEDANLRHKAFFRELGIDGI